MVALSVWSGVTQDCRAGSSPVALISTEKMRVGPQADCNPAVPGNYVGSIPTFSIGECLIGITSLEHDPMRVRLP